MPRDSLVVLSGLLASLFLLTQTDATSLLLSWYIGLLPEGLLTIAFPFFGVTVTGLHLLGLSSLCGWGLHLWIRHRDQAHHRVDLAFHPAAILLALGGLGMALLGLTLVLRTIERMSRSPSTGSVAALGMVLAFAALTVPRFELLFLALASPLFLCAPRAMQQSNMAAFYGIVLTPALLVLALNAGFGGLSPMPRASLPAEPVHAALPLVIFAPLMGFSSVMQRAWRPLLVVVVAGTAALLSQEVGVLWPLTIFGLGMAIVVRRWHHHSLQVLSTLAFTVAVVLHEHHILQL